MDREMPKKVDPLLLGVWLVLQASQAPMGGWGSEGRARERPELLQAFLGEPSQATTQKKERPKSTSSRRWEGRAVWGQRLGHLG